ncbi:hypothetical protein VPH35_001645 [Triticum aestivum]
MKHAAIGGDEEQGDDEPSIGKLNGGAASRKARWERSSEEPLRDAAAAWRCPKRRERARPALMRTRLSRPSSSGTRPQGRDAVAVGVASATSTGISHTDASAPAWTTTLPSIFRVTLPPSLCAPTDGSLLLLLKSSCVFTN